MRDQLAVPRVIVFITISLGLQSMACAGPPMVTKEPDILAPGQWRITTAVKTVRVQGGRHATELPVIGAHVAVSENWQFGAAYRYVHADPGGAEQEADFGNPVLGAKWRFYRRERLQVAIAPAYVFGIGTTAAALGIGSDTAILSLPITAKYSFGAWTVAAEFGYAAIQAQADEVTWGLLLGRRIGTRVRLMVEGYGATNAELDDNFVNFNVGADITITRAWHLLVSAGSGIKEPAGAEKLDHTGFVGIRYFSEP